MVMMRLLLVPVVVTLAVSTAASQEPLPPNEALIARAKSFELDTPYVPPPGDALEHHTSGFAKIMCSAVFITGLDPEFAAENIGYFTSPYAERSRSSIVPTKQFTSRSQMESRAQPNISGARDA
jgi:hypothetical protein